ncbi:MAG: M24 family metallopeptidase [Salinibacter sp.]|uniref:M24 family metallopeptidase n=1 Tax=Salinibacter sp. TaxID=2065818 RepID=UPI0035D3E07A
MKDTPLLLSLLAAALLFAVPASAQVPNGTQTQDGYVPDQPMPMDPATPTVLSMEQRAAVVNDWLETRLDTVVAAAMRAEGIDLWVVSGREYNEDPVLKTMLPATWQSARRRTILVFYDRGPGAGVERLAVSRYDVGDLFKTAWDKEQQPDQWARLAEIIKKRDPERIAINRSKTFALADGMTDTEQAQLKAALPARYEDRLVSGEEVAVRWLETRTREEQAVYPLVVRLARSIIATGLSEEVIQPGVTTTTDLQWWYRSRIRDLNLTAWFHPTVSVQRPDDTKEGDFSSSEGEQVIRHGDLLHVDLGISYLRLHTDTQQHAYVLRPGETEAPGGLQRGLREANRVQDLLTDQFETGRTGNEVLRGALTAADSAGINATIYAHPIGFHGHAAGPLIGLWDQQDGVPGKGEVPLRPNTAYSIELNVQASVPEWGGQEVLFRVEEDALFTGGSVRYLDGRQTQLYLIPRQ